ncbi:hypothetical protein LCGC14_1990850 [marine sediment metagenome]|uniref:Uncharacterized protein n=1 Tax=marine sediment metagenome TaxID=412755 RepID=A0A0F9F5Z2_9ZZZZ
MSRKSHEEFIGEVGEATSLPAKTKKAAPEVSDGM